MKPLVNQNIGERLFLRRTMLGLSQKAVAEAAGITFQQVQKYEKGSNAMNATRLYELAQIMHISVAYFFEDLDRPMAAAHKAIATVEVNNDAASPNVSASHRESLEMMKAFKCIKEPLIRKRLSDLVRVLAESSEEGQA